MVAKRAMQTGIIDQNGYRLNVGIVLANASGKLLWARRFNNSSAWQFPQGGILPDESLQAAMYRELHEELGLSAEHVACIGESRRWFSYRLPAAFIRHESKPLCIGQRQKWFLLRLIASDQAINLNHAADPEFDQWCWVDYWYPIDHVIAFKRQVYVKVLKEFQAFM